MKRVILEREPSGFVHYENRIYPGAAVKVEAYDHSIEFTALVFSVTSDSMILIKPEFIDHNAYITYQSFAFESIMNGSITMYILE